MKNFTYYRPDTAKGVVALLDTKWGEAELMGGGTDLLDLTKEHVVEPDRVISVNGIESFDKIVLAKRNPPIITIGGGTTLATIAEDATVRQYCAALATAAGEAGTPQIRNVATLGGNLCQRNRCWYFRDEAVKCTLKGGTKCYAVDGENQYHAIFTRGKNCVCVSPSTIAPALMVLNAEAEILGPKGTRTVSLDEFFQAPESEAVREHVVKPNEMVTAVRIDTKSGLRSASYEVRHKQSYDWPLTQACVSFTLAGGKAKGVKVALGHVAPVPMLSTEAAQALEGNEVNEESAEAAGEAAARGAKPLSQNAYKVKLLAVAVKRAILTAAGKKRYWEV